MTRNSILAAFLVALALSCSASPKPPPEPIPVGGEGGTAGSSGEDQAAGECSVKRICTRMKALACVPSSARCVAQINTIQDLGERASIDLDCLCKAKTAAQVRKCESLPCGGVL